MRLSTVRMLFCGCLLSGCWFEVVYCQAAGLRLFITIVLVGGCLLPGCWLEIYCQDPGLSGSWFEVIGQDAGLWL